VTYGCFANWEKGRRVSAKAEPRLREVVPDAFGVDEVANLRRVLGNVLAVVDLDLGDGGAIGLGPVSQTLIDEARGVLRG
jgi:hypothetical protein